MAEVKMVRIYLTEADKLLQAIMYYLHNEANVHGVTVIKAIAGFGQSGVMHNMGAPGGNKSLPIMLEFFDSAEKVDHVIPHLKTMVGTDHIISWSVDMAT